MKLAKLFLTAMLAICTMAFVACENNAPDTPNTPDTPKEYALELTSDAVMEFPAEGGEGLIAWKLNEVTRSSIVAAPSPNLCGYRPIPTFTTAAEWITLYAEDLGAFAVSENEGEAREAVITVTYGEQVETVTIKQAGVAVEVQTTELVYAERLSCEELELPLNYFAIVFADDAETVELGLVLVGAEEDEVLMAGRYNVDTELSQLYFDGGEYMLTEGVAEVKVDGEEYDFDITVTADNGQAYRFVYVGEVVGMVQASANEPVAFEPVRVKAERYMIGNFFLQLYIDGTRYHELDMYDEVTPNDDMLSAGTYTYAAETISTWSVFSTGNDQTCALADAEITLVHNEDNTTTITGYIKSEEGDHITIDWTGVVDGFIYEKETGLTFNVDALSAKVQHDKAGQKDIIFMVDEFSGHVISFKSADILQTKPLADGEYSSETGTIDIAYCVHGYGDGYGNMTSATASVVNNLEAGTTTFDVEWEFEGNTYQLSWEGAVEGIMYQEVVETVPLDFEPIYVEMVRISSSDKYFYFYDAEENELVCELYNGKIYQPYINYEGVKLDISTEDYTFELDEYGLGKNDGVRSYNVRFVTLDGRLIEFDADLETYVNY